MYKISLAKGGTTIILSILDLGIGVKLFNQFFIKLKYVQENVLISFH